MKVSDVCDVLEAIAPLTFQEDYDNAGLLLGDRQAVCTGILCTLDVTEEVLEECIVHGYNMIVAHHPLIFRGLKKITGSNEVERVVIKAIRAGISVYAAHTNLDNVIEGVNGRMADRLGMSNRQVLQPRSGVLKKLFTFVPATHLDTVRDALFAAGAGEISRYSECSFTQEGVGTFKPGVGTSPFSGEIGERRNEAEIKLEVILPGYLEARVLRALFEAHPYEEVAYDLVALDNKHRGIGSGIVGDGDPVHEAEFLNRLRVFNPDMIRHSPLNGRKISRIALCGGSGSFLISAAIRAGADALVTSDLKYHEFFTAEGRLLICDVGHFESEQFTMDLFVDILQGKFPNFAVLKSGIRTSPVHYFTGN